MATPERFWRFAQKYIAFEEPDARWQKLGLALKSNFNRSDARYKDFDGLDASARVTLAHLVFGNAALDMPELLLTAILALEDFDRFEAVAFESWLHQLSASTTDDDQESIDTKILSLIEFRPEAAPSGSDKVDKTSRFLYRWAIESGYSNAQARWLSASCWVRPAWSRLREQGEWSADERVGLLLRFLDRAASLDRSLSPKLMNEARTLFRAMLAESRARLPGSFLPNLVLLVEGPTEAMLLPYFAKRLNVDLDACGVVVVASGGANQVVRRFLELRDTVALPIVIVLDADAGSHASTVEDMLREQDRLHVLTDGEIEDVFDIDAFVNLVNEHLSESRLVHPVSVSDFSGQGRRTLVLDRLYRQRGLGRFDKIGFARTVVNSPVLAGSVPVDVIRITQSIQQLLGDRLGRRDNRQG